MMILSILLKAYALVLWSINWPFALGCWMVSALPDLYWLRARAQRASSPSSESRAAALLQLQAGALLTGAALRAVYFEATLRWKSGFPAAARAIEWLFALLKFPTGSSQGRLYAGTMAGTTSYPVNLDTLGLLLPLLFCTVGCVYLLFSAAHRRHVMRGVAWLIAVLVPAVLLRWIFATGLFLALGDFVNYETQDLPITPFFKPGVIALLYLPFMGVAAMLLHRPLNRCTVSGPAAPGPPRRRLLWCWVPLVLLLLLVFWEPKGARKNGRVLINTYHTDWSRTDRPYDREWYGAGSGYNYACLKRLYEGFFDVRELTERITSEALENTSVLIIFDPNRSFTSTEIQAVQNFVARGGGLFVIGDHTNVFGSSSHLNQIVDGMGFLFRDDVLFDLDTDFFQLKDLSPLHPGVLHGMTFFKFRGPGSIKSTALFTRNIFTLGNAKSLRAIYSVNNFYPPPHDHPKMWTGDFAVAVNARHGRGRVAGFADSTVFSNFEIFYPGKYEYLLNTIHWLNHVDNAAVMPLKRIGFICTVLLLGTLLCFAGSPRDTLNVVTLFCLAATATWMAARLIEQAQSDFPEPVRPMRYLFFAAEPEDEALTLRAFTTDTPYEQKFDVFIQWVLRADVFSGFHLQGNRFDNAFANRMRNDDHVATGMALIATRPDHLDLLGALAPGPVTEENHLLLMFSGTFPWEDIRRSLAELLSADGLAQAKAAWPNGTARIAAGPRRIAIVFQAERFSDREMGFSEKVVPNAAQRARHNEQFELMDWLFGQME